MEGESLCGISKRFVDYGDSHQGLASALLCSTDLLVFYVVRSMEQ